MEVTDAVMAYTAQFLDVTVTHKDWETLAGKRFRTFYVNRRGTVLQFVAPYPLTDEREIEAFVAKIRKEL